MSEPVNVARLVFGNPENGVTNAEGYNAEFIGKDNWDDLIDLKATSRHAATVKENLWLEKHTGAIMLKPIITLDSMVDGVGYTTTGGSWEVLTIPGRPALDLLYQYDRNATGWKVEKTGDDKLSANEGFMVYWEKYATPSGSSGDIVITLAAVADELYDGSLNATFVKITISPRDKITIERNIDIDNTYYDYEEKQEITIPKSYYEAAEIDGASIIRQFWHVTLPMLSPYIFFNMIMGVIGTLQIFAQAFIMTNGGPVDSTLFYVFYLFNNAFRYFRMGYASALAWILFVIILILTVIQVKLAPRWVYYESEQRGR